MAAFPPDWEQLETSMRGDVDTQIAALLAALPAINTMIAATNAELNANPAIAIRELARDVRLLGRQVVRMSRLVVGAFDTGDTGT